MKAFFRHALIGAPILFVISCFFLGGIGEASQIIMLAVICTAGISLIVIIPACALTGWIAASIFALARPGKNVDANDAPPPLPSRDCLAIAAYLRQAAEKQFEESAAVEALVGQGWSEAQIREAQGYLERTAAWDS